MISGPDIVQAEKKGDPNLQKVLTWLLFVDHQPAGGTARLRNMCNHLNREQWKADCILNCVAEIA